MVKENNRSDEHLIVNGLTVINGLNSPQMKKIENDVDVLRGAQSTMAEQTIDYWSKIADDGIVSPGEKKILYKEWEKIKQEYVALLEEATASGLVDTAPELIQYKSDYEAIYNYIEVKLKLFDDMQGDTELDSRELFIAKYNAYYGARDKLRIAIKDGELADMQNKIDGDIQHVQDQIKDLSQGGVADGSITAEKLASGIKEDILKFEGAAATGFLTDDILKAIDTSTAQAVEDLTLLVTQKDEASRLYIDANVDSFNALVDNAERQTRSMMRQTSEGISLVVEDQAEKVATQFQQTADAIQMTATNLQKDISAGMKISADRISEMVTAGSTDAYLGLSVGVPYFITTSRHDNWAAVLKDTKNGVEYLNAVYEKVNVGSKEEPIYYYVMGADVTKTQVNSLTNYLRQKDALASSVVIDADMVQVGGTSIFSSEHKLKESYYDFATVSARTYLDNFIGGLMEKGAWDPDTTTIIEGGFIKTGVINAAAIVTEAMKADLIMAGKITVGNKLISENYETSGGKEGFALLKSGKAIFQDSYIRGTANITDGEFSGSVKTRNFEIIYEDGGSILFQKDKEIETFKMGVNSEYIYEFFRAAGSGTIGIEVGRCYISIGGLIGPYDKGSLRVELIMRDGISDMQLFGATYRFTQGIGIDVDMGPYRDLEVSTGSVIFIRLTIPEHKAPGGFIFSCKIFQKNQYAIAKILSEMDSLIKNSFIE